MRKKIKKLLAGIYTIEGIKSYMMVRIHIISLIESGCLATSEDLDGLLAEE